MIFPLITALLLVASLSDARVTFTFSEVLQGSDIPTAGSRAAFKCVHGCMAYTDSQAEKLLITKYNYTTKVYDEVTTFAKMGDTVPAAPVPFKLDMDTNYFIENRGEDQPSFVFYVVDNNAKNIGTPVYLVNDDWGFEGNGAGQGAYTLLSSTYDAVLVNGFKGKFPNGYPRIYSTGFDAVAEEACSPMYKARSQENAELASITVFSPVITIDYGYSGEHTSHVKWSKDGLNVATSNKSSVVYTSPGYVGCSYTAGQSYWSATDTIGDGVQLSANGVDVSRTAYQVATDEAVQLFVDEYELGFSGSGSANWNYTNHFVFYVSVQWKRTTPTSSWAVQIDFGTLDYPAISTTAKPESTTSGTSFAVYFASLFVTCLALYR